MHHNTPDSNGCIPKEDNIPNRLKNSGKRLREMYQKQKEILAGISVRGAKQKETDKASDGTRKTSKEEMLAMQSENYYLLDSYNKNGQYCILGK